MKDTCLLPGISAVKADMCFHRILKNTHLKLGNKKKKQTWVSLSSEEIRRLSSLVCNCSSSASLSSSILLGR